jgi:hypothetical protein
MSARIERMPPARRRFGPQQIGSFWESVSPKLRQNALYWGNPTFAEIIKAFIASGYSHSGTYNCPLQKGVLHWDPASASLRILQLKQRKCSFKYVFRPFDPERQ